MEMLDTKEEGGMKPGDGRITFEEFKSVLDQDPLLYKALFPSLQKKKKEKGEEFTKVVVPPEQGPGWKL